MSKLDLLKKMTTIVSDTGDINAVKKWKPQDATTNPSLILKAAEVAEYKPLLDEAKKFGKGAIEATLDKVFVNFGVEILKIIPGRVSTEVDAHLSFDVEKSVAKARHLVDLYKKASIPRERILIKLASTWEGVQACKILEKEGIHCNMTLLFSLPQAIGCAEAKATLISPFVGRILDWYKKAKGVEGYPAHEDPGVLSVREIYTYYKHFEIKTQVMGASFRNKEEIIELAGCDLLTIAPDLLNALSKEEGELPRKLDPVQAKRASVERIALDEAAFRWELNENAMATEKLAEGIRNFASDYRKLEKLLLN